MSKLIQFGWNGFFEAHFAEYAERGLEAARVAVEHRNYYEIYSASGVLNADKSGKLFYNAENKEDLPSVGDWVAIKPIPNESKAQIEAVLPRKTKFSRKSAGVVTEEQIVAANLDYVFIMNSLNQDLNLRRIERYLTLAWDNGVSPVIVLNKSDLCDDIPKRVMDVEEISLGTPIHAISALQNTHVDDLMQYFTGNKTVAVIGSSGVGKSTLINDLVDWTKMKVNELSLYKDKGKHTTSHRELIVLPSGGMIIDTPGMREIQLWEGGEGIAETFEDIEALVLECKFSDCKHESEPGCAVKAALKRGDIDELRYRSYKKLLNEIRYFENKQNIRAKLSEKRKWKNISKDAKKISKNKYGGD